MDIRYLGASKRYSEAVVANGLVFLSGMVPENPEADAKAQTENVFGANRFDGSCNANPTKPIFWRLPSICLI